MQLIIKFLKTEKMLNNNYLFTCSSSYSVPFLQYDRLIISSELFCELHFGIDHILGIRGNDRAIETTMFSLKAFSC